MVFQNAYDKFKKIDLPIFQSLERENMKFPWNGPSAAQAAVRPLQAEAWCA
jgi:hypothetical protein